MFRKLLKGRRLDHVLFSLLSLFFAALTVGVGLQLLPAESRNSATTDNVVIVASTQQLGELWAWMEVVDPIDPVAEENITIQFTVSTSVDVPPNPDSYPISLIFSGSMLRTQPSCYGDAAAWEPDREWGTLSGSEQAAVISYRQSGPFTGYRGGNESDQIAEKADAEREAELGLYMRVTPHIYVEETRTVEYGENSPRDVAAHITRFTCSFDIAAFRRESPSTVDFSIPTFLVRSEFTDSPNYLSVRRDLAFEKSSALLLGYSTIDADFSQDSRLNFNRGWSAWNYKEPGHVGVAEAGISFSSANAELIRQLLFLAVGLTGSLAAAFAAPPVKALAGIAADSLPGAMHITRQTASKVVVAIRKWFA